MATNQAGGEDTDVLRNLGFNTVAGAPSGDADLAIAKMLQEQEYELARLAGIYDMDGSGAENIHPADREDDASRGERIEGAVQEDPSPREDGGNVMAGLMAGRAHELQADGAAAPALELAHWQQGMGDYAESDYSNEWDDDSIDPDNMTYEEILEVTEVVGVVNVGLSPKAISALPVLKYSAARQKLHLPEADGAGGAAVGLEKCVVCLEEYEEDVDVTCLPCCHLYHPGCIDQWLTNKKTCPLCMKEISNVDGAGQDVPIEEPANRERVVSECVPMEED